MGKIEAVIFDWAGTTVDFGCFAPVQAFVEVFKHFGIEPTMEEVRKPMGMLKRDHIKTMLSMERIHRLWLEKYGHEVTEEDIDSLSGPICRTQAICAGNGEKTSGNGTENRFDHRIHG